MGQPHLGVRSPSHRAVAGCCLPELRAAVWRGSVCSSCLYRDAPPGRGAEQRVRHLGTWKYPGAAEMELRNWWCRGGWVPGSPGTGVLCVWSSVYVMNERAVSNAGVAAGGGGAAGQRGPRRGREPTALAPAAAALWSQHRPVLMGSCHPALLGNRVWEESWGSPCAGALAGAFPLAVAFLPHHFLLASGAGPGQPSCLALQGLSRR